MIRGDYMSVVEKILLYIFAPLCVIFIMVVFIVNVNMSSKVLSKKYIEVDVIKSTDELIIIEYDNKYYVKSSYNMSLEEKVLYLNINHNRVKLALYEKYVHYNVFSKENETDYFIASSWHEIENELIELE